MGLSGRIRPAGASEGEPFFALNDVVVARGSLARVVRLDVSIGPSHLATYVADGLVVASPTGSTGYSFSAGGPILDPTSRNLVVTPIAGYLSAIRSIVVGPEQTVSCRVVDAHEALASIDGREDRPLAVGDVVTVGARPRPILCKLLGLVAMPDGGGRLDASRRAARSLAQISCASGSTRSTG